MSSKINTQYYVTLPNNVVANVYDVYIDIDTNGQVTQYQCRCKFDPQTPVPQKAMALLACVQEATSISLLYHKLETNEFNGGINYGRF